MHFHSLCKHMHFPLGVHNYFLNFLHTLRPDTSPQSQTKGSAQFSFLGFVFFKPLVTNILEQDRGWMEGRHVISPNWWKITRSHMCTDSITDCIVGRLRTGGGNVFTQNATLESSGIIKNIIKQTTLHLFLQPRHTVYSVVKYVQAFISIVMYCVHWNNSSLNK